MAGAITINGEGSTEPTDPLAADLETVSTPRGLERILIVERDSESVRDVGSKLAQAGFSVKVLDSSAEALAALERDRPHLVMLDWDMPGFIAMQLMMRRLGNARAPRLIALSAFSSEQDVVSGFELGIDDYVVKPFSALELVARVRAILRSARAEDRDADYLEFGSLRMDAADRRVTVLDGRVGLRGMEFRLLEFFMRHPERAFNRETLLRRIWGRDSRADPRVVDVTVQRIRYALSAHRCQGYLQTIRGVGYRLSANGVAR